MLSSRHAAFRPTPSRRAACRPHPRCPHHHHRCHKGAGKPGNDPARYRNRAPRRRREAYLVANSTTAGSNCARMPAWRAALADAGVTVEHKLGGASNPQVIDASRARLIRKWQQRKRQNEIENTRQPRRPRKMRLTSAATQSKTSAIGATAYIEMTAHRRPSLQCRLSRLHGLLIARHPVGNMPSTSSQPWRR